MALPAISLQRLWKASLQDRQSIHSCPLYVFRTYSTRGGIVPPQCAQANTVFVLLMSVMLSVDEYALFIIGSFPRERF